MWADRILESALAKQALDSSFATPADLQAISDAYRRWAAAPDGWMSILHGEVVAVV